MNKILKLYLTSLFVGISVMIQAQVESKTISIGSSGLIITMDKRISDNLKKLEESCIDKKKFLKEEEKIEEGINKADICKDHPRILGFKIQVAIIKSKEEAIKLRDFFVNKFPDIKVELDASLRPNYKILAGSYFSKESGEPDLKKVKSIFKSANLVQHRIFCVEAK